METLEHLFFECILIKNIWLQLYEDLKLSEWFHELRFDLKTIILGFKSNEDHIPGINTFILLVKAYIFNSKNVNVMPSYKVAKRFLEYHCEIHKNTMKFSRENWLFLDAWTHGVKARRSSVF